MKAGLASGRELLFKLGDDVASLLFVLIAFEFRDKEGEFLSVRWPRLVLCFESNPQASSGSEPSNQKRRTQQSKYLPNRTGRKILEYRDNPIHSAAPSVIGATMRRSIFLGKKRGLCLRRAVYGKMPDNAFGVSGMTKAAALTAKLHSAAAGFTS